MFPIRRAALRFLSASSSPVSLATRSRTYTSFIKSSTRPAQFSVSVPYQRRWATADAQAAETKPEEEVPVTKIQPSAQEEVDNAIVEENAAVAESASAQEAAPADAAAMSETTTEAAMQSSTESTETPSRTRPSSTSPKQTLFVGNLFFDVTENDLNKEFGRFGEITRVRIIRDSRGLSKGFGYIEFKNTTSATSAVEELNQQLFEGRRLNVQFAHFDASSSPARASRSGFDNLPKNPPSKTLFIGNMSFEMTDRDLNNLFRGIRNVIDVRVAIDRRTGQPRGFAHADFTDVASAQEAAKVLESKETYGRKLRIDFSHGSNAAPRNSPRE